VCKLVVSVSSSETWTNLRISHLRRVVVKNRTVSETYLLVFEFVVNISFWRCGMY